MDYDRAILTNEKPPKYRQRRLLLRKPGGDLDRWVLEPRRRSLCPPDE